MFPIDQSMQRHCVEFAPKPKSRLRDFAFSRRRAAGARRRAFAPVAIELLEGRLLLSTFRVTSLHNSGHGSLRSAILEANRCHEPATIKFAHSLSGSIELASALPALKNHITIVGPPASPVVARSGAAGTPDFGIFTVARHAVVKIEGLSISNGIATRGAGIENAGKLSLVGVDIGACSASVGGGFENPVNAGFGGGIDNSGTLSVSMCAFINDSAVGTGAHYGYDAGGGAISNSGTLSITDTTFSSDSVTGGSALSSGNGDGGAIYNTGVLTVTNSTFSGNSATGGFGGLISGGGNGAGGGIDNTSKMSVTGSTFTDNSAAAENGGFGGYGAGGGIESSGTGSVTTSTFSGNSAQGQYGVGSAGGAGGGIENSGTLTVTASTLSGNSASGSKFGGSAQGGGIDNSGTLSVITSTLSGNTAAGGTVYADSINDGNGGGINNSGTLTLTASTLSGNSTTANGATSSALGGGINNSGTLSATNSTISGNSAATQGGGIASSGGTSLTFVTSAGNSAPMGGGVAVLAGSSSNVTSIDTIFQNQTGGNISVAAGAAFTSLGHNLFSDTPAVTLQPTDLVNTNPLLAPLGDNGGPTDTQALLNGSPATNAGIAVMGITTDQRGDPRPTSGVTDIGAFQVQT
jgi:hypothetical protein